MNAHLFGGVNIHEDRLCLEKLDEQIERAIQELDSLNNHTNYKILSNKLLQDQYYSPSQNFAPSTKCSSKMQSGGCIDSYNNANSHKYTNQGYLQLSPENLFQDAELKELEYSSIEQVSRNEKTNYTEDEELLLRQKENLNPFNMLMLNNEIRKQNQQTFSNDKYSPLSRRCSDITSNAKENTSRMMNTTNRDVSPRNPANARKSIASIIEYHQFSNIDLPKEKVVGNSKPEHYFGSQQNLRRQSASSQEKSYANPKVVDRLLQYGRDKDTKLKARIEEQLMEHKRKPNTAKPPKGRLSASFMGDKNDNKESIFYCNEESTSRPLDSSEMADTPFHESLYSQGTAQSHMLAKRQSLPQSEMTPAQLNQMLGLQMEAKSISAAIENDDDPFYQLYKEAVTRNNSDGYPRNQSMSMMNANISGHVMDKRRLSNGMVPNCPPSLQSLAKVASTGSTNPKVDSRYVSGRDSSKSPRVIPNCDSINPPFRPQLSKRSLEIASKLGNSSQRLMEKNDPKTIENRKKIMKEMEKELTFKPKVNKTSQQLDMQYKANLFNGDELHRWDQLYLMKDKYEMEREMKKVEQEELERMNDECTFQPQLNPTSSRVFRDTSVEFADRCNTWKEFKEKKLNKERKMMEEKELSSCTFQPELLTARSKLVSSRSEINLNDVSQVSVRGLDQHFEKIDRANRMKKEVEARQEKFQGKGWKRQVTVPKGFEFHKRGNSAKPYSQKNSMSNLDISTEERVYKNTTYAQNRRDVSPQTIRQRETVHQSYLNKNTGNASAYNNFGDAVARLHHELQRMEI